MRTRIAKKKNAPWLLPPLPGETEIATNERRNLAYFEHQRNAETAEWIRRMDLDIHIPGLRVLDFGCGHGALSVHFAELGAAHVTGIDLDSERVAFATRHLSREFPELEDRVQFLCQDVRHITPEGQFDLIVSKDSFEHIDDLPDVVEHLNRLLKPGGHLATGFSPLYFSPFGDHARFALGVPWAHAVVPEAVLAWWLNLRRGTKICNSMELGLNRVTPRHFRSLFEHKPAWDKVVIHYNRGDKLLLPLFNVFRQFPPLERFFTISIYSIVRKTPTKTLK